MKKTLFLMLAVLTLAGCKKEMKPEDVAKEYASGVVTVVNKSYYLATLKSGMKIYFTDIDKDGNLVNRTQDKKEILKKCDMSSASGTVVDADGKIIVPSSLFKYDYDTEDMAAKISTLLNNEKIEKQDILDHAVQFIGQAYMSFDPYTGEQIDALRPDYSESDVKEAKAEADKLGKEIKAMGDDVSAKSIKIERVNEVAVAFNGETVKSVDDLLKEHPCELLTDESDAKTGLSVIRLKDGKLPKTATAFSVEPAANDETVDVTKMDVGQQLYMLCTTADVTTETANQPVKVEISTGKLIAVPTQKEMMYDFNKAEYNSGSPVLDLSGRIVAINITEKTANGTTSHAIALNRIQKLLNK